MISTQPLVEIDDFMKEFEADIKRHLVTESTIQRDSKSRLALSEIMTIIVFFRISGYRDFKYYIPQLCLNLKRP